ncbi:sigma 54-interacting transcriptional regulator [Ottowia thiooxydans]|uniref:sigma 54-interacting transcriptional regulator n=1 Tax=Ottowia thiooxydans TaxID=219182 RepID=UPI0004219E31|nr:sigma 54-interacting transcriptional regulator [Ottowia thiooxydans]
MFSSVERLTQCNPQPLHLPVVITDETGTGKELAANAIHELSPRAKRPFFWVNCAATPENLINAELFGYEGGSIPCARSHGKPGALAGLFRPPAETKSARPKC